MQAGTKSTCRLSSDSNQSTAGAILKGATSHSAQVGQLELVVRPGRGAGHRRRPRGHAAGSRSARSWPRATRRNVGRWSGGICRQSAKSSAICREGRRSSLSILRRPDTEQPTRRASCSRVRSRALRCRITQAPNEISESMPTSFAWKSSSTRLAKVPAQNVVYDLPIGLAPSLCPY